MNLEELKQKYYESKNNDEIIEIKPRIYGYKNEPIRNELQKQADMLLPIEKQLAIYLHKKMCKYNHTDACGWYYEIKNLEHKWSADGHKRYLQKAIKILDTIDFETAKKIVNDLYE